MWETAYGVLDRPVRRSHPKSRAAAVVLLGAASWIVTRGRRYAWILVALVTAAVGLGALHLDRTYARRAGDEVLLPNGYADLLRRQLERWRP